MSFHNKKQLSTGFPITNSKMKSQQRSSIDKQQDNRLSWGQPLIDRRKNPAGQADNARHHKEVDMSLKNVKSPNPKTPKSGCHPMSSRTYTVVPTGPGDNINAEQTIANADPETGTESRTPATKTEAKNAKRSVTCSKVTIAVLLFLLLCTGTVFGAFMWKHWHCRKHDERPDLKTNESEIERDSQTRTQENSLLTEICLSSDCVRASAAILESIDESVNPCENFYGFVCNGWIDRHPIPKGQSSWSVTDQRADDNLELLRALLEKSPRPMVSESERKAQLWYRACLDSQGRIEELDTLPLLELIESVGGWNLTQSSPFHHVSEEFDLPKRILAVQNYTTNALFHWYIREGMYNTSRYELFIHQGGLTLPSKEFYTRNKKAMISLFRYISEIVDLLGGNAKEHKEEIQDIVKFEYALAQISSRDDDITGLFVPLDSVDHWISLSQLWGSWKNFFNQVIDSVLKKSNESTPYLNGSTSVWIQFEYLNKLGRILMLNQTFPLTQTFQDASKTERTKLKNTVRNYLVWRALQPYIAFLPKDFQKAEKAFWRSLEGSQGREERWRTCVTNTNAAIGFAMAPSFVKSTFSENSRTKAYEMIEEIKMAFADRLNHLDWISHDTAQLIKDKITNITELLGYPDIILDRFELDKTYEDLKVSEDEYFKNQIRFHRFALAKNLKHLSEDVDKRSWPLTFPPSIVNAFYMYSRNQILFPAGVLQPPLFSDRQPMALNFGHIGTFMGHEILHAFDDTGRLYSPAGQKTNWWPNITSVIFQEKARCFVKQYSQEIFSGRTVDGRRTLSENIADNGGLMAAYFGFKSWEKKHMGGPNYEVGLLPGSNFTADQLFFVGFARAHCLSTREKAMDVHLLTDRHSPAHVRVNTAVGNLPEFADAFQCPFGSALRFPERNRCSVW